MTVQLVRPLPCAHPFSPARPELPAHQNGHCLNGCGYALRSSSFEPLGAFCSWRCLEQWKARPPETCAACGESHDGDDCLAGCG